jgi:hypothetical protein
LVLAGESRRSAVVSGFGGNGDQTCGNPDGSGGREEGGSFCCPWMITSKSFAGSIRQRVFMPV